MFSPNLGWFMASVAIELVWFLVHNVLHHLKSSQSVHTHLHYEATHAEWCLCVLLERAGMSLNKTSSGCFSSTCCSKTRLNLPTLLQNWMFTNTPGNSALRLLFESCVGNIWMDLFRSQNTLCRSVSDELRPTDVCSNLLFTLISVAHAELLAWRFCNFLELYIEKLCSSPTPSLLMNNWAFDVEPFMMHEPVTSEAVYLWKFPQVF